MGGIRFAWIRLRSEVRENLENIKSGLKQGVADFTKKVPGGSVIVGGLQKAGQAIKKGIDEARKAGKAILAGLKKLFGF